LEESLIKSMSGKMDEYNMKFWEGKQELVGTIRPLIFIEGAW
jgi:hypothetical protein